MHPSAAGYQRIARYGCTGCHTIGGEGSFGPDLTVLRAKGDEIKKAIDGIPGVINLKTEDQVLVPQVQVRLRPDAASRFGLSPGQVRHAVATLVRGTKVGEVYEDQKTYDVVVRGSPHVRSDIEAIRDLPIDLPFGGQAPLKDVAEVYIEPAPNEIKRESASRRLDVTCNVAGRDLGSVARDIEAAVKKIDFPSEYHPEYLGEYAARQASIVASSAYAISTPSRKTPWVI